MADCHKSNSSCGSNTDSLIEKIRLEITKKSDEDLLNIKKLTIQASNKSRESTPPSRDIDRKISDLECLIKRLQEELNDMYCASKRAEDDCEDMCSPVSCDIECAPEEPKCPQDTPDKCQSEEEIIIDKINTVLDKTEKSMESAAHRYPIILRDIDHVQEVEDEDVFEESLRNDDKPTIIIKEDESDGKILIHGAEQNIPNIGQKASYDWDKNMNITKGENNPINDKDSITVMIAELRAEINDTIHTLNENSYGPSDAT